MTKTVDSTSSAVDTMSQNWPIVKTLMGGTAAIRKAGKTYLPQWPGETDEHYKPRLATATLYPAFKRTVEVLAAKPFSKALTLSDSVPARMIPWLDNVDLQGRNLQAFASDLMSNCISYGISGVLVDYPKAQGINTVADEKATGVRPYFIHYPTGTVLGWKTDRVNGADKLVQLRLKECKLESDGEYGDSEVEQIRVLVPGAWQLWQKNEKKEWVLVDNGTTTLKEIPFVTFYGNRTGFMTGEPPLIELAYQNVEHYQSSSDQQTILHVARVPILSIIGGDEKTIAVGTSTAVNLPHGADMKFVEHSGAAIGAGRTSLLDLEERMRQSGSQMLLIQRSGVKTATQTDSEDEGNRCALQRITENFEDALDQCLQLMANWVGESEGGNVELFKDFGSDGLSDASSQLIITMQQSGLISKSTAIKEQKRRGVLSPDIDPVEELDRVESEGPPLGLI